MTMQSDLLPPVTLSEAKNYLSDQKMYDILLQAGWPKHLLEKAYEIAFLESSPAADVTRDYTGDASYGVFQQYNQAAYAYRTLSNRHMLLCYTYG